MRAFINVQLKNGAQPKTQ